MNDDALKKMLSDTKTIAVVGLSKNWSRPSNFVAKYMLEHDYDIVPVNPKYDEIFGLKSFRSVSDIPYQVDMVNCFRKPDSLDDILYDTIEKGINRLWLQIGIINFEVAQAAKDKGIEFVMDRCLKIEHARVFGGLNFVGVNTKVISSKRSKRVYN